MSKVKVFVSTLLLSASFSLNLLAFEGAFKNTASSGKSVTLSGYLSLSGLAYVPSNNSYVTAYLNGWLSMRDSSGNYYTNNTYLNVQVSFWASSNYVYTTAYPNTYLTVYNKEGKVVGSGYLNQGIGVSGWINGNYVNLNGSGYVSMTVYVNED
ncbi:MAG: hypothetical protein K6357_03755 [Elusimicrobiota bacterium]